VKVESFTEETDREQRDNRPWGPDVHGDGAIEPGAGEPLRLPVAEPALDGDHHERRNVWSSGSLSTGSIGPSWRDHRYFHYDRGGKAGSVHVWTIGPATASSS
jgi:hypothetical protein